ncbi:TetR/AcrR family transcriptional regulator [Streptomyces sp. NPDC002734]|uniref:TetR/AcrR family transcriptional regulator n=1 Tax=Streptomyces sp. NPDC002734 TaxID=3154426 RepID=UPI00331952A7
MADSATDSPGAAGGSPGATGGPRRPGRPPLTERRKEATRLEIAHEAVQLFVERGLAATSWDDIGRAVGVSTRTLSRYFGRKEECVRPLLTVAVERFVATLRAWPAERPLHEITGPLWPPADSDPDMGRLRDLLRLTRAEPGLRTVWLDLHYEAERVMVPLLAERTGPHADPAQVRALALVVNGTLRLAVELWVDQDGAEPYADIVHGLLRRTVPPALEGAGDDGS